MEESSPGSVQKGDEHANACSKDALVRDMRMQLSALMVRQVAAHLLAEQDAHILTFRLGLEDGKCYTLNEVSCMLHISPEKIRQRQYLSLKRNLKDTKFFKLLRDYARLVKLPRGVTYYLCRYGDGSEKERAFSSLRAPFDFDGNM